MFHIASFYYSICLIIFFINHNNLPKFSVLSCYLFQLHLLKNFFVKWLIFFQESTRYEIHQSFLLRLSNQIGCESQQTTASFSRASQLLTSSSLLYLYSYQLSHLPSFLMCINYNYAYLLNYNSHEFYNLVESSLFVKWLNSEINDKTCLCVMQSVYFSIENSKFILM